jgi:hypothetical protein
MHVLQRIAVQADSKDQAFRTVKDTLESELGNNEYSSNAWFDWFVTGGGRWNSNPDSQYNDDDQSMTISYEEEPDKFISQVALAMQSRVEEFNRYRQHFNEKNVDINAKLDSYDGSTDYSFDLYDLSKMIDMLQGKWDFNSYFFDMTSQSVNEKFMLESIDKGEKNWYIVFVDFHF